MKGDDLSARLIDFAVRVIRLVEAMPSSMAGKHIGNQLLRAGTSAGANYEEARGAERRADFIHKLGVSWKELREASYWLKVIRKAELVTPTNLDKLMNEAVELNAIFSKSLTTA